jgi:hypothetical protein
MCAAFGHNVMRAVDAYASIGSNGRGTPWPGRSHSDSRVGPSDGRLRPVPRPEPVQVNFITESAAECLDVLAAL